MTLFHIGRHWRGRRDGQAGQDRHHARGDIWSGGDHHHPGGRGGRGFGRGFGQGGGLGRLFAHGDLHFVILHLIAAKPRHGYEIIKAIEAQVGGAYSPSPGSVYPALTMLEEQGYVTVTSEAGGKKLQVITDDGRAYLEANRGAVDRILRLMNEANAAQGGEPAPQIVRAVANLKLALRLRLAQGDLSDAQIRSVTEALDRAAGEIEQS